MTKPSTVLLEAFALSSGGSEAGIGRVCAETLCQMPEINEVLILTGSENPALPENTGGHKKCLATTIPMKTPWIQRAYGVGNMLGGIAGRAWNQMVFCAGYINWLKKAARKAAEIELQTPLAFALHATYANLVIPSRLGTALSCPVVSLGSVSGRPWEMALARAQSRGWGELVALSAETLRDLGGTPGVVPIAAPQPAGLAKTTAVIYIDQATPRKNAGAAKVALAQEIPSLPVTILTNRPEFWAGCHATIKALLPHREYLKELETHEFLLTVGWREAGPTSALEALHLGTIPIAMNLSWTNPLCTIACGTARKAQAKDILAAITLASQTTPEEKNTMKSKNLAWAKEHTGHGALKKSLRAALNRWREKNGATKNKTWVPG